MDNVPESKRPKPNAHGLVTTPIRVSRETKKRLLADLVRLNKKDLGRHVRADEVVALALSLLEAKHYTQLQDATLSNSDRLERRYREYVKKDGAITTDEFIGKLLTDGTVPLGE